MKCFSEFYEPLEQINEPEEGTLGTSSTGNNPDLPLGSEEGPGEREAVLTLNLCSKRTKTRVDAVSFSNSGCLWGEWKGNRMGEGSNIPVQPY